MKFVIQLKEILKKFLPKKIRWKIDWRWFDRTPFIGLKKKRYFGDISIGTPYFLPRKLTKPSIKDAEEAWEKLGVIAHEKLDKEIWINNYLKNNKIYVPATKFKINIIYLGWKTKYDEYRFEWSPGYSIVLFGKQYAVHYVPNYIKDPSTLMMDCYWEAVLVYNYETDKTKPTKERLFELFNKYSCSWLSSTGTTDYYYYILKKKYLKYYDEWLKIYGK